MCPFLNSFKFNLNKAVAQAITEGSTKINVQLLDDLKVWNNFLLTPEFWLPIPHEKHEPPIACLNLWTDAAGFPDNGIWTPNIGCGVYGSTSTETPYSASSSGGQKTSSRKARTTSTNVLGTKQQPWK
jgi:hypothetical protein